jgi:predicted phosphodiesterase
MRRKTLSDFEKKYGGSRIAALEEALDQQARRRNEITLEVPEDGNSLLFGLIGDTHFGSLYEAKDELAALYKLFEAEGVKNVLHSGDVIDGHRVYRGQEFELHKHGWKEQRDWFAEVAPRIKGITTHFITGNHDASMKKAAGIDVGNELSHVREDWNFIGEDHALVVFETPNGRKYSVMLLHPGGGSSYALSYRAQKIIEQIEGGQKPNMLVIGHFHKADFLPTYRNVSGFQSGCFQFQTPFMVTKGLSAHVGGWIVRVTVQPDGVMSKSVKAEFVSFYKEAR